MPGVRRKVTQDGMGMGESTGRGAAGGASFSLTCAVTRVAAIALDKSSAVKWGIEATIDPAPTASAASGVGRLLAAAERMGLLKHVLPALDPLSSVSPP